MHSWRFLGEQLLLPFALSVILTRPLHLCPSNPNCHRNVSLLAACLSAVSLVSLSGRDCFRAPSTMGMVDLFKFHQLNDLKHLKCRRFAIDLRCIWVPPCVRLL